MLRRFCTLRWPALAATVLLAAGWFLSHRGTLWIAPQVGGRVPILLLASGLAQVRLDPLPMPPTAAPPPLGFSAAAGFIYH